METKKYYPIPLKLGHYGGFADTAANLLAINAIPLGYFYGNDVIIDDAGNIRARPGLSYLVTYAANTTPISMFRLGATYYSIVSGGKIQYWSGSAWIDCSSSALTYTGQINVDYTSTGGSSSANALVSTSISTPKITAVNGTTSTNLTPAQALGIAGVDNEDRVFCYNGGYFWYSDRSNYNSGYDSGATGEWFAMGPSCYDVATIMNIAGSLHVIKQTSEGSQMYIYRKSQMYSDPNELLDSSVFTSPLGTHNFYVGNGIDGVTQIGGNIVVWGQKQGLGVFGEAQIQIDTEPIRAGKSSNLAYDCILAGVDNHRLILVKPVGLTTTWAYDYLSKRWYHFSLNVTCKGFGERGGMFGVSGTKSPAILGDYPTTAANPTGDVITPSFYTPVLSFEKPYQEKFLKRVVCLGKGVSSIAIYTRMYAGANFALAQTLTNPEPISYISGDVRFGEMYLLVTGAQNVLVEHLGVEVDIGPAIII